MIQRFLLSLLVGFSFFASFSSHALPRVPNLLFEQMRQEAVVFARLHPATQSTYRVGTPVLLRGLNSDSFNGAIGIVMSDRQSNGRYQVHVLKYSKLNLYTVEQPFQSVSLKPENLGPVGDGETNIDNDDMDELMFELAFLLQKPTDKTVDAYQRALLDQKDTLHIQARAVGWFLHHHLGMSGMMRFLNDIFASLETSQGSPRVLEIVWNNIGDWQA